MYGDQFGEFCLWILGLKEVMDSLVSNMETCIADSSNNNNNKIFI